VFVSLFQRHLLSVFDNTKSVTFDEKNYDKILAITSQESETVQLKQHVMATVSADDTDLLLTSLFCRAMLCISAAYAVMRCLSVCLCLSVTFAYSVETNIHIFIFSPSGSQSF